MSNKALRTQTGNSNVVGPGKRVKIDPELAPRLLPPFDHHASLGSAGVVIEQTSTGLGGSALKR